MDKDDRADPADLLDACSQMYVEKDAEYGSSWSLAGETMAMWCDELGIEELPTDERSLISIGLYFQRFHKLTRAFNCEFALDEDDLEFESIADSHLDEPAYAAMHASLFVEDSP